MTIKIAGRTVRKQDPLFHVGLNTWGVVEGFDVGTAILKISGANGAERRMFVQNGGMVNGVRAVYWHEPLVLDLPTQNIGAIQSVVDAIVAEFYS